MISQYPPQSAGVEFAGVAGKLVEVGSSLFQLRDPLDDFAEPLVDELADVLARRLPTVPNSEDLADLAQREPSRLRVPDEDYSLDRIRQVVPVARWSPRRLRQQTFVFIEAQGLRGSASTSGQLTNEHGLAPQLDNAAHGATSTGTTIERGLVDDVLLAAWLVRRRHGDKVLAATRPWAYLMSSAQKQVLEEIRAQQLLTNTASIRGRARQILPSMVRPIGSTAIDLATPFRHELSDADDARRIVHQVRQHEQPPLVAGATPHYVSESPGSSRSSTCWSVTVPTRVSPWPQSTDSPTCSPPPASAGGNGQPAATPSSNGSA